MKRRMSAWLIILFIGLFISWNGVADTREDSKIQTAPLNPEFLEYVEDLKNGIQRCVYPASDGPALTGATPPPLEHSHVKGTIDENVKNMVYPPYYDLREHGKMTEMIRSQIGWSCWFHATMNSLESYLMPEESRMFDAETPNLIENHGFSIPLGGDYRMSTAVLIRWDAPTEDLEDSYNYWRIGFHETVQKHVQRVTFLPAREHFLDNDTVKYFVMKDGAVYFCLYYTSLAYNNYTGGYYYHRSHSFNHGVAVVGWDDNYSRDNFKTEPPGDGAFIVRNSWGTFFADEGYFYVSYYDTSLQPKAIFNSAEDVENYSDIYYHDPLGMTTAVGRGSTECWGANVFTAKSDQPLEAVGFYVTDQNVNFQIQVYKHPDPNNPTSGELAASQTGSLVYPGFHTTKLDNPAPIKTGERFSVVVQFRNPNYKFPVPVEKPILNYSHFATGQPGESFISRDGTEWEDITVQHPDTNICIKAYSRGNPTVKPILRLALEEQTKHMWLITKRYALIAVTIDNIDEVDVSQVVLFRSLNNGEDTLRRRIPIRKFVNGKFTFADEYSSDNVFYTYHAVTLDSEGGIINRSQRIEVHATQGD